MQQEGPEQILRMPVLSQGLHAEWSRMTECFPGDLAADESVFGNKILCLSLSPGHSSVSTWHIKDPLGGIS